MGNNTNDTQEQLDDREFSFKLVFKVHTGNQVYFQ